MNEAGGAIVARCHCGDVTVELSRLPAEITRCNCSLCRKTGFRGIYYRPDQIRVSGPVDPYVRSDLDEACLINWHCRRCGCPTHWTGLGVYADGKVGVNARLVDADLLSGIPVKDVDGASW